MRSLGRCALVFSLVLVGDAAHAEDVDVMRPIPTLEPVSPEPATAYEKISLTEAVRRALTRHPIAVVAFQEVNRSQALLAQARAGSMPSLVANLGLTRLDADRLRAGTVIASQNQQSGNLVLNLPLIAPRAWTNWSEASMHLDTTKATSEDTRRTLAVAVARAYLAVISLKRQVDTTTRTVANDRSHYEYTHTRFAGGVGRRMDEVRAAQQLAVDQALLSSAYTSLARAREALSVLVAEDKPVDTLDDIVLPHGNASVDDSVSRRQDVQAAKQRALAAEKVRKDSWADYMPVVNGQLQPFFQHPASFITPETGWQAMLVLSFPLIEGGLRRGQLHERDAVMAQARAQYEGLVRQTRSDLRVAVEALRRADEAMRSASAAAELAHQGLLLANLAYHAGATTNIEVTDAERRARDADSAVVGAEDTVRQARLDLLVAGGRFP